MKAVLTSLEFSMAFFIIVRRSEMVAYGRDKQFSQITESLPFFG